MSKKVLIVDDDPTSNTLVKYLLKTRHIEANVALNAHEGLSKAREERPDLIVLDITMPEKDGFTLLAEFKSLFGADLPPVIMLTAKDNMQEVFKMEGVADYFVKPFKTGAFLSRVEQCLEG